MGIDVCKVSYKTLYGHVTEEEINFIENCFSISDSGTYLISKQDLSEAVKRAKEKGIKVPRQLMKELKKELSDKYDSYDIQIL